MTVATARTPLHDLPREGVIRELPLCGKLNLRGKGEAFSTACEKVLGLPLPQSPNTIEESKGTRAYWVGPDEWVVHLPLEGAAGILDALREALAGIHAAVIDITDYYTVIALDTPLAAEIIACGSAFDTRDFAIGQCAQTRFGHASILLWPTEKGYAVQIRWSYARYLYDYFQQSLVRLQALHDAKR